MNERHKKAHMNAAIAYSNLSYCVRKKVGCLIVKEDTPIAFGYNGTPSGEDNCCEEEDGYFTHEFNSKPKWISTGIKTKPNVIHAEDNALRKLTRSTESAEGSSVFITTAPCKQCAVRLKDAKIKEVFYLEVYHCTEGVEYLEKYGIHTEQVKL